MCEAVLRGGLVEPVADDHFVAVPMLIHGLTLVHRLRAAERELGVLVIDPDLAPLREPASMGARLGDGERIHLEGVTEQRLVGPAGWLEPYEPGTLLALRLHRAQVVVEAATAEPPPEGRGVDALLLAAERLLHDGAARGEPLVEIWRVVWAALAFGRDEAAARPHLLDEPAPPLGEVFTRAGYVLSGEWLHRRP